MKIILFHQYFLGKNDPGGSRWNQLTKYFIEHDSFSIDVMAGNIHYATGKQVGKNIWYNKEKIDENITVHRTWTYSGYNSNFVGRLIGYFSYTFSSLWKSLFLTKPDIIIVTSPSIFVGISALVLSKVKKVPFIFEVRDLWPESAIATGVLTNKFLINILYYLEKKLYKHAKRIIVLTPAFKTNIEKRFPKYSEKIDIITNAADFELMKPTDKNNWVREKYDWKDKKVFAYFGTHGLANDLMQVIEVAKKLKENSKVLFVLIGDGMQKPLLKEKAKEYDLNNVQFIDSVSKDQVGDFINASDICMAILKKTDTFKTVYPNKVFDYMSCKRPSLVTIDGITRELIENSESGYYSEPENSSAFYDVITKILSTPQEKLDAMGENGYDYVKTYFNREELSKCYIQIIKNSVLI
jgi:glycosyltransferase involved in cell wall biosynthesis